MSSTMFSGLESQKSRSTGHCTVLAQIWPADPSLTAVCEGATIIHLRDVYCFLLSLLQQSPGISGMIHEPHHARHSTNEEKSPCPRLEAICISGCNLAPNLELN